MWRLLRQAGAPRTYILRMVIPTTYTPKYGTEGPGTDERLAEYFEVLLFENSNSRKPYPAVVHAYISKLGPRKTFFEQAGTR